MDPNTSGRKRVFIHRLLTRKHGLGVSSESLDYITEILKDCEEDQIRDIISRVANVFLVNESNEKAGDVQLILNIEQTKTIFSKISSTLRLEAVLSEKDRSDILNIPYVGRLIGLDVSSTESSSSMDLSKYFVVHNLFTTSRVQAILPQNVSKNILNKDIIYPNIRSKREYYKKHYDLLYERVASNEQIKARKLLYNKPSVVTKIGSLKGSTGRSYLLLGMLIQLEENKIHLDDLSCSVELCFDNEALKKNYQKLCQDVYIIVLSDVWLDIPEVLHALNQMFDRLSSGTVSLPYAIVLCGDFNSNTTSSYSLNNDNISEYKNNFANLAKILQKYQSLSKNVHFVFVPGISDHWCPEFLPRPPIPEIFTKPLKTVVKNIHFTSNPCKQNLVNLLCQNAVLPPKISNEIQLDSLVSATILNQSNLSPIPMSVFPVLWGKNDCLLINEAPDVIILADNYDCYSTKYRNITCINPSPFMSSGYTFIMYQIYNKQCTMNRVFDI